MAGLGFPDTHWTLIARAQADPAEKKRALDEIAEHYRGPLLRYARARGVPSDRAEDLVQSAFANLLSKDFVLRLDRECGRLRGFLKAALDHELLHAIEQAGARKRGGDAVTLDIAALEELGQEPSGGLRPDDVYEREWALAVAEGALDRLRAEFGSGSMRPRWPVVERFFREESPMPYADAAQRAGITVAQFKVTLHRARTRFEELLRLEIADQTESSDESKEEEAFVRSRLSA